MKRKGLQIISIIILVLILFVSCDNTNNISTNTTPKGTISQYATEAYQIIAQYLEDSSYGDPNIDLYELIERAKLDLGEDDIGVKLMDNILVALICEYDSIVKVGQQILEDDFIKCVRDPYSDLNFINDYEYAYKSTGADGYYIVYDFVKGLFGIYSQKSNQYICEPQFEIFGNIEPCGLIPVGKNGYWGCVNQYGEKIIGFMYENYLDFTNGLSVAQVNGKYGVIDTNGKIIMDTKYDDIIISSDYNIIFANWPDGAQGKIYNSSYAYGVYNANGVQIIPHSYLDYTLRDNKIYMLENTYGNESWYDLYDCNGNLLFGEGTSIPEICAITLPGNYGISIGRSNTKITNKYGVVTPGRPDYWYRYITKDMKYLNNSYYQGSFSGYELTMFNEKGYAIASIQGTAEGSTQSRVVLTTDGTEIDEFLYIYGNSDYRKLKNAGINIDKFIRKDSDGNLWYWLPSDANDYLYHMTYTTYYVHHALYIRSTGKLIECDWASMVEGTNLTLVKDNDSNLYGLYDGEDLVLDYLYTDIQYDGTNIIATRGAEKITYTPTH